MSRPPNDGFQPPPSGGPTSSDRGAFERKFLAGVTAATPKTLRLPSPHSSNANSDRNSSVERLHAPHAAPVTSMPSLTSSSETSAKTIRLSPPSLASERTASQENKRRFDLISHEDYDDIKPYRFAKVPPSKKEVDHASFKEAERAARSIPAEMISIIDNSSVKHSDIDFIRDMAVAAMLPKAPSGVKLGLKGESGAGKSSIINSLLGVPNLAPQGDAGKACTAVVHEYHKPRVNQHNTCEAEIVLFTAETRSKILKEWVQDVFIFDQQGVELGDDCYDQERDAFLTAIDGLFSLFCDRDECQDHDSVKKFLSSSKSKDDKEMTSKLAIWAEELLNSLAVVSRKISISGITPQDIQTQISRYTRHQKFRDMNGRLIPSIWPFVDVVRIFYKQPILLNNLILVDLPGTQDINQTRSRASMRYLSDVDYIGIVSRSDRLQTDNNVHRYLREGFLSKRGASTLSVNMSPTSLDEKIEMADAIHAMNLTTLREKLHDTTVKHQQITCDLNHRSIRQDQGRRLALFDQQRELQLRKESLENSLFEYCVELRNEDTSQTIRRNYYNETNDPVPLPVFCVSNLIYAKCTNNNNQPPMMSIESTNIPALRAFLYELPAFRKFKAFEHHHENVLPSLLNSLDITCSPTKVDGREELHQILLSAPATVPRILKNSFKRFFDEAILPGMAIIKTNRASYATHATNKLTTWSNWPIPTFRTFCIHKGNWCTPKVGRHDWNEEMLELLVLDVEKETKGWDDAMRDFSKDISAKLGAEITGLIAKALGGPNGSSTASMKLFVLELQRQQLLLEGSCQARVKKLQRDLIAIKEKITDTQDMDQSYFVRTLEETYEDCGWILGSGSHSYRVEGLKSKISKKFLDPFSEMYYLAYKDAWKAIQRHEKKLTQEVTHVFESLNQTFVHGFMAEGADKPEVKEVLETLRAKIPHWRGILTGKMTHHLEICREYAKSG